jgi:Protein of unknown function (DUF2851)
MNERLFQYIWQFRYFNERNLLTIAGEPIKILHPGKLNTNQGPDFLDARILIDDTIWVGNIELHIRSSDWKLHQHSNDINYKNIILHVVWQHDIELDLAFPTIELNDRIAKPLLSKYDELMNEAELIPCSRNLHRVEPIIWSAWKERLLVERLEDRFELISGHLQKTNNHWEEVFWWLLARNFGVKVNTDAFEKIAQSIPLSLLAKHKQQLHQTEALLFGQAGLLTGDFSESYPILLQKEYRFLQSKYKLVPVGLPLHFLRMRPSNFPTVRLAQLAMLVHNSLHLFSKTREAGQLKEVKDMFSVTANDYWHYHYTFEEVSAYKEKNLGAQMIDAILINTVVPVLFAYGHYNNEEQYKLKALEWLEQIEAERNTITNAYAKIGVINKTAFDSQSLIQLKSAYCSKKRCLECAVGNRILNG